MSALDALKEKEKVEAEVERLRGMRACTDCETGRDETVGELKAEIERLAWIINELLPGDPNCKCETCTKEHADAFANLAARYDYKKEREG